MGPNVPLGGRDEPLEDERDQRARRDDDEAGDGEDDTDDDAGEHVKKYCA